MLLAGTNAHDRLESMHIINIAVISVPPIRRSARARTAASDSAAPHRLCFLRKARFASRYFYIHRLSRSGTGSIIVILKGHCSRLSLPDSLLVSSSVLDSDKYVHVMLHQRTNESSIMKAHVQTRVAVHSHHAQGSVPGKQQLHAATPITIIPCVVCVGVKKPDLYVRRTLSRPERPPFPTQLIKKITRCLVFGCVITAVHESTSRMKNACLSITRAWTHTHAHTHSFGSGFHSRLSQWRRLR